MRLEAAEEDFVAEAFYNDSCCADFLGVELECRWGDPGDREEIASGTLDTVVVSFFYQ